MAIFQRWQGVITAIWLISTPTMAAEISATANIELVPAIQLSEQQPVDFGLLSNVNGSCTMDADGTLDGDPQMNCTGVESPGKFTLNGQADTTVQLSVTYGQTNGISFYPLIDGETRRTIANGNIDITIAGTLSINNAINGSYQLAYTLTANYQ